MSFNKEKHLRANIEAIKLCFQLEKEKRSPTQEETEALKRYVGFGALKCILNPFENLSSIAHWSNSEVELFPLVVELYNILKENSTSEQQYKQYIGSLKNSILTAFYTPPEIVQVIAESLYENGISPTRFLDPSAGLGEFISAFKNQNETAQVTGIEKDLLTGKLLSHLYPNDKMRVMGFEEIENRYNNHFDVVSSNIPFGDVAAFDISYLKSKNKVKQQASRSIHNYFFLKGIETLREGGILAFITSHGVMNSPKNESVRRWLMENSNLVSSIRLPNNLFRGYAGTEVGSDLIVLQKDSQKNQLTPKEKDFIKSEKLSSGVYNNTYFNNFQRVVHTEGFIDTNPYGKPAQVFIHKGGINGIADDLKKLLEVDLAKKLNQPLFQKNNPINESSHSQKNIVKPDPTSIKQPSITLYDLFDFSPQERTQKKPIRNRQSRKTKGNQLNLFSRPNNNNWKNPLNEKPQLQETRKFSEILKAQYKAGSLVKDSGQVGFLKELDGDRATFKQLRLNPIQQSKAMLYINIRDSYHQLYNKEANDLKEDSVSRQMLNSHYDSFVEKYGQLNDSKNLGLLKMDSGANEILALERSINGELVKADIFNHPVAFSPNKLEQVETSEEALAASLNKFGEVNTAYMLSLLDGKSREELTQELHTRIYYNPLVQNYEVGDKFIAGNVVEKAEKIGEYLNTHPNDVLAQESLIALQNAKPQAIPFDELDFNFGERWIPAHIYSQYASHLFKTETNIHFSTSVDEFSVKVQFTNANIYEKYAIKSQSRLFDLKSACLLITV